MWAFWALRVLLRQATRPPRPSDQKDCLVTSHEWGRVDDDGTVFVRTPDGERPVGQYPEGTPEEALTFYTERFAALETEVQLLEQRVRSGKLTPDEATTTVKTVRTQVTDAHAVGDLQSLAGRLDSLGPVIAGQRLARKEERAEGRGGEQDRQGGHRRGGREARGLPGLAQRRHPDARAARPVEGAAPHRPGDRRRAVEAVLGCADDVHPPPQGPLRRAAGEARRRPGREGAAGQAGRGAGRLDGLGADRGPVSRPDARLEGRRPGAARHRRRAVEAVPGRPGRVLRRPRRSQRGPRRGVRCERRGQAGAAGRGRGTRPGHRPRRPPSDPSATSP